VAYDYRGLPVLDRSDSISSSGSNSMKRRSKSSSRMNLEELTTKKGSPAKLSGYQLPYMSPTKTTSKAKSKSTGKKKERQVEVITKYHHEESSERTEHSHRQHKGCKGKCRGAHMRCVPVFCYCCPDV
jgi:hypothetical protein